MIKLTLKIGIENDEIRIECDTETTVKLDDIMMVKIISHLKEISEGIDDQSKKGFDKLLKHILDTYSSSEFMSVAHKFLDDERAKEFQSSLSYLIKL